MKYKVIQIYNKRLNNYLYKHDDVVIAEVSSIKKAIHLIQQEKKYLTIDKTTNRIQPINRVTTRYIVMDSGLNVKYKTASILLI